MQKLFSQINQTSNLSKQISNNHLSYISNHIYHIILEIKDCHIWKKSLKELGKELGKEELSFTMELTGGQFVMIFSTWLQLTCFADLSIPNSELLAGKMLIAFHTPDPVIFLMDTKNQFWWTIYHALEMKINLVNAHIDKETIAITEKTS